MDGPASRPVREKKFTEKGEGSYEGKLQNNMASIGKIKRAIFEEVNAIDNCKSVDDLRQVEDMLIECSKKYDKAMNVSIDYCNRINTKQSKQDAVMLLKEMTETNTEIKASHTKIEQGIAEYLDTDDTRSRVSQRNADTKIAQETRLQRTIDYVIEQSEMAGNAPSVELKEPHQHSVHKLSSRHSKIDPSPDDYEARHWKMQRKVHHTGDYVPEQGEVTRHPTASEIEEHRQQIMHTLPSRYMKTDLIKPDHYGARQRNKFPPYDQSMSANLSKFLIKKDLVMSRLTNFNDTPENYLLWKDSFLVVTNEFTVTPSEELDLLVKYLGPASRSHAISIRASNARHPERGLRRIWERLDERYGSPELLEAALKRRLSNFQKISVRELHRLYDLADLLSEIESAMENEALRNVLSYYNASTGIMPIVSKLPYNIQERWVSFAADYKRRHHVSFPPFTVFVEFVHDMGRIKNDPSLQLDFPSDRRPYEKGPSTTVKKTDLLTPPLLERSTSQYCPLHRSRHHNLIDCRAFRELSIQDKRDLMKQKGYCFACCTHGHIQRECKFDTKCEICGNHKHHTLLHVQHYGEEDESTPETIKEATSSASSKCTQICGRKFKGKSCAKIVLVRVYHKHQPQNAKSVYAILDDQSNRSLIRSNLLDELKPPTDLISYSINSCNGQMTTQGRQATGLVIEPLDGSKQHILPTVLECDQIPNDREEIPTPDVVQYHPHLTDIARFIPDPDHKAPISLLIGRDVPELHHVHEQITDEANPGAPFAQRLSLGWVIVGETCLGKIHQTTKINVNKINVVGPNRPSILIPCTNRINIREDPGRSEKYLTLRERDNIKPDVFHETPDDEKAGMSKTETL